MPRKLTTNFPLNGLALVCFVFCGFKWALPCTDRAFKVPVSGWSLSLSLSFPLTLNARCLLSITVCCMFRFLHCHTVLSHVFSFNPRVL
jgi:hypothetical protein